MNKPLVSICIPIYNGEAFLAEALASVKTQTYPNLEVVVSDDRSSDASLKIIEEFKKEVDFPVHIFSHEPQGIGANWNHCVAKAQGTYIKFLFQDDVLLPTCIEKMVKVLESNASVGLVACKRGFIVEDEMKNDMVNKWLATYGDLQAHLHLELHNDLFYLDKTLFKREDFKSSPLNKVGEPSIVMFKKTLWKKVGGFDTNLKQILDYVFCYRILKYKKIVIINEELALFRVHGNQETNQNRGKKIKDYEIYNEILYKEFLKYLHPKLKEKLLKKYSFLGWKFYRLKKKIKHKLNA